VLNTILTYPAKDIAVDVGFSTYGLRDRKTIVVIEILDFAKSCYGEKFIFSIGRHRQQRGYAENLLIEEVDNGFTMAVTNVTKKSAANLIFFGVLPRRPLTDTTDRTVMGDRFINCPIDSLSEFRSSIGRG
jgi:hypothetical protein